MSEAKPHRRIRWWWWTVAGIVTAYLGVCIAGAWLGQHNQRRYDAAQVALAAQGFPCTRAALPAGPDVDEAMQAQAWRLLSDASTTAVPARFEAWLRGEHADAGDETRLWLDGSRARVDAVRPLLASGRVRLSNASPSPLPPHPGMPASHQWTRYEALMGARAIAAWLRVAASTEADPLPRLVELDRLVAACAPPAGLVDLMLGDGVSAIRDQAWYEVAQRRELPEEAIAGWVRGRWPASEHLAAAWRGERCNIGDDLGALLGPRAADAPPAWVLLLNPLEGGGRAVLIDGQTRMLLDMARLEARARGRPSPIVATGVGGAWSPIAAIAMPNLLETEIATAMNANHAHLRRLAVAVAAIARARGRVPADRAELATWIDPMALDADVDRCRTGYIRVSDARGVLSADLAHPPTRLKAPRKIDDVEIRLAARALPVE